MIKIRIENSQGSIVEVYVNKKEAEKRKKELLKQKIKFSIL